MKFHLRDGTRNETGVALLLALFALVLISAVGVAIVFMSTGESSIAANERSYVSTWEAAKGGLEEMRGRLSPGDAHYISAVSENRPQDATHVFYIVNPGKLETVKPWDPSNAFFDSEYPTERCPAVPQTPPTYCPGITILPATSALPTEPSPGVFPVMRSDMQALVASGHLKSTPSYKWMRLTIKTEASAYQPVSCVPTSPPTSCPALNATNPVTYNGTLNRQSMIVGPPPSPLSMVYVITALAVLPNGTRRMAQYEVAYDIPVVLQAAIDTQGPQAFGTSLTVGGSTDPVCTLPSTDGADSGGVILEPVPANITGSPHNMLPATTFPYNVVGLVNSLSAPPAIAIDTPGTGVTGSGTPTVYSGPHAILGTAPTVTYDGSGGITVVSSPGSASILYSNGDLTLGTSTVSTPAVTGQGTLIVQGNLTINITNGFNYFGLIIVTGNITMTVASPPPTSPPPSANIHGAVIAGGTFNSIALTGATGGVFIRQNACLINSEFQNNPLLVLGSREATP